MTHRATMIPAPSGTKKNAIAPLYQGQKCLDILLTHGIRLQSRQHEFRGRQQGMDRQLTFHREIDWGIISEDGP